MLHCATREWGSLHTRWRIPYPYRYPYPYPYPYPCPYTYLYPYLYLPLRLPLRLPLHLPLPLPLPLPLRLHTRRRIPCFAGDSSTGWRAFHDHMIACLHMMACLP